MITHLPDSGPHPAIRRLLLALALILALPRMTHAADGNTFTYNGVNYIVLSEADKTCATRPGSSISTGGNAIYGDELVLSEKVTYNGNTYTLTEISEKSFCTSPTWDPDANIFSSITIPRSVKKICDNAFSGLQIKNIHITDIAAWCKIEGLYYLLGSVDYNQYNREGVKLFLNNEEIVDLMIPKGVTSISSRAFNNIACLKSVTIPETVETIGSYAFKGCGGLKSVIMPKSVKNIESNAFSDCPNLKEVHISDLTAWCSTLGLNNLLVRSMKLYLNNSEVKDLVIPDNVSSIADYAFRFTGLTSVTIPESVIAIGSEVFRSCRGLTSLTLPESDIAIGSGAFQQCIGLTSVTIPGSVTAIGGRAFADCTGLTSVTLKEGLDSIGYGAFSGCKALTSVNIPNSIRIIDVSAFDTNGVSPIEIHFNDMATWWKIVPNYYDGGISDKYNLYIADRKITDLVIPDNIKTIDKYKFCGCYSLTSVTIPESVTSIGEEAFRGCVNIKTVTIADGIKTIPSIFNGCTGLTSITIPKSITEIEGFAFYDCTGLKSLVIPETITTIGYGAFGGCKLNPLILEGDLDVSNFDGNQCLEGLDVSSSILCKASLVKTIQSYFSGMVNCFDWPLTFSSTPYIRGIKLKVDKNPYCDANAVGATAYLTFSDTESLVGDTINISPNSEYRFPNLKPSQTYRLNVVYIKDNEEGDTIRVQNYIKTVTPSINYWAQNIGQTLISLGYFKASYDELSQPKLILTVSGTDKHFMRTDPASFDDELVITGLTPGTKYTLNFSAGYGDGVVISSSKEYTTHDIALGSTTNVGPTSAAITGTYDAGDAVVESTWWDDNSSVEAKGIIVTGLKPNTSYTHTFHLVTDNGYSKSKDVTFTTPALELSVSDTKGVSATKTIVTATTNISDAETSVGFQWKKNDAPSTLKPREAYAVIYNGQLEGSLNNLQSTYYDVRAFYKDADGTYYYSDWLTFDPTDFSYFDPTVHTYPMSVEANETVVLNGYALGGTDDILSQGFQYWYVGPDNGSESTMNTLAADDPVITTVEAAGQKMSATIGNLRPESVYAFRAFVKTASGYTYGEEQQFVTGDFNVSAIDEISADEADKEVVGYYNLTGLFSPRPYQGFNIVLYSDGSTRKMIIQ